MVSPLHLKYCVHFHVACLEKELRSLTKLYLIQQEKKNNYCQKLDQMHSYDPRCFIKWCLLYGCKLKFATIKTKALKLSALNLASKPLYNLAPPFSFN